MDGKNLAVDAAALVAYLVAANPSVTGVAVHEWLGLGVAVVLLVHVVLHADWVFDAARTAFRTPSWARTGNFALDALVLIVLAVCLVSGVLVSGAVLPALGLYAPGYYFWDPLHAVSAKVLLALLVVHVVVHWKWFVKLFKKMKGGRDVEREG